MTRNELLWLLLDGMGGMALLTGVPMPSRHDVVQVELGTGHVTAAAPTDTQHRGDVTVSTAGAVHPAERSTAGHQGVDYAEREIEAMLHV